MIHFSPFDPFVMTLVDYVVEMEDRDAEEIELQPVYRQIRPRLDAVSFYSESEFRERFRMSKATMMLLLQEIIPFIPTTKKYYSIDVSSQLLIGLRYLSIGTFQQPIGDLFGVHRSTVSRICRRVLKAIAMLREKYINFPSIPSRMQQPKVQFYSLAHFPGVIGAIDGTHIPIKKPSVQDSEIYRNRKGIFSINVQAVCDAALLFTNVVARWPGSTHDARIFANSNLKNQLEHGNFGHLLGDAGYACSKYLLTPVLRAMNPSEKRYNAAHIRTRSVIERAFGCVKKRFPCLANGLKNPPETCVITIVAAFVLHNFCLLHHDVFDQDSSEVELNPIQLPNDQQNESGILYRRMFIEQHFS